MFPEQVHKSFYFGALILLAISLPFSVFTLSMAQIILLVNWILEGKFNHKWKRIKQSPSIWAIGCFYPVHLLWMINTSDFSWGFHELRMNLPLLVLPLVISTSDQLRKKKLIVVLNFFIWSVFAFSLYSGYFLFSFDGKQFHTIEELSPIIWHIRWALMVVMAIFILGWLFFQQTHRFIKLHYIIICLWLIIYLFLFKSLTGIAVFIITSIILLFWVSIHLKKVIMKWFVFTGLLTILLIVGVYVTRAYIRFNTFDKVNFNTLDKYTAKGNPYSHDTTKRYVENGHYDLIYVCDRELKESWGMRSKMDFDGKTKDGGQLRFGIIRYLTSKGLRKDANGMEQLSEREIKYIESGKTNVIDTNRYALYPRLYISMLELYQYKMGANPSGYSLSQRIEFLKTSVHIIHKNFWLGIGTGDVPTYFDKQYAIDKSPLTKRAQLWATNQLFTFFINFGLIGFVIIIFSLLAPPFFEKRYSDYLFLSIFVVGFLSFLDEDMFETHPGISMFAFFYSLFLYYNNKW